MPKNRIVADSSRCSNCRTCEMVCSLVHEGVVAPGRARMLVEHDAFADEHPRVTPGPDYRGPEGSPRCDLCGGDPQCVKYCPQRVLTYEPSDAAGDAGRAAERHAARPAQDGAGRGPRFAEPPAGADGYAGRILRVDLTSGRIWNEPTAAYAGYLGGLGIAARIYLEEVAPGTDPFAAENLLIFMSGRFTGTPVPSSGRSIFYSGSPVGYPRPVCRPSSIGGHLGAELKYAGFDGLVVGGAAERPVYLWIEDGETAIHDAGDLWGQDTFTTQQELLARHDPRGAVAAIGPSGENLGRMAAIVHGTGFASGLSGFGAVMGSKKLKAFGVRGSGGVAFADPCRLLQLVERTMPLIYDPDDPPRMTGMRRLGSDYPGGEEFVAKYSVGILACHACPSACQGVFKVPGTPLGADCCVWPHSMAVGFTEGPDGWRAAWEIDSLVNRLGLSMYEVHQGFQFVRDLQAAGLLDAEKAGLPLDGDPRDLVRELADQIAHRRGLGALLAEQLPRAAEQMNVDLDRFVTEVRGWPILMPWDDPRLHALRALLPAAGGHFPPNEGWMFWSVFRGAYNVPAHRADTFLSDDEVHRIARRLLGDETATDADDLHGKAETLTYGVDHHTLADALGFCTWVMPIDCSYYDPELRGDRSAFAAFYSAVTGVETGAGELTLAAARIHALERLQGVRRGYYSREHDRHALQRKLFDEPLDESPLPGGVVDEQALGAELDRYYELRGWDLATGAPTAAQLERLGAGDLLPFL